MNTTNFVIKADDISFTYDKDTYVFENVTFEIPSHSIFALVGKNGSGKTTLLNCLSGYYPVTKGTILCNGEKVKNDTHQFGYINSNLDLIDYLTIDENIEFFLKFNKINYQNEQVDKWLGKYELLDARKQFISNCSAGMKKKAQIIIAFLTTTMIILADEPFNALDEKAQETLTNDFCTFVKAGGTVIVVNHDNEWIKKYSDFTLSMDTCELSQNKVEK